MPSSVMLTNARNLPELRYMHVTVIILNKSDMQIKQDKKYTASNAISWHLRSLLLISNTERFKKI